MKGSIIISTADKGGSRNNGGQMAAYLQSDKNREAEFITASGTLATDPRGALLEMEALAKGSRCRDFLYHYQINPKDVQLSADQYAAVIEKTNKALGLDDCQYVAFRHVNDKGREHYHVVVNRVHLCEDGKLRAVNMGNDARTRQEVARACERDFGLDGLENRPLLDHARGERAPQGWEYQQAERLEVQNPRDLKAEISTLYGRADNGAALQAALAENGYTLARGDKEGVFLVVDERGGFTNLTRSVDGVKAADVRAKLADLDRTRLPTLDQVRAEQHQEREAEKRHGQLLKGEAKAAREASTPHAKTDANLAYIRQARAAASDVRGLVDDLQAHGFTVARIEGDKDLAYVANRKQAFALGDLVALAPTGRTYRVTETERDLPWQAAKNGFTPQQEAKAQTAFARWEKAHQSGKPMDFATYVAFVQAKHEPPHLLDFKAFDASALPTLDSARDARRQAQLDQKTDLTKTARALRGLVSEACAQGATGEVFTGYLAANGYFVAQDNGRAVVVNKWERSTAFGEYNTGLTAAKIGARLEGATLPDTHEAMLRAENYRKSEREVFAYQRSADREEKQASADRSTEYAKTTKNLAKITHDIERGSDAGFRVVGCTLNVAGKALDKVADVAEAILSVFDPPKPRKITPAELWASKEAYKERVAQLEATQKERLALGRITEQARRDKTITYADLASLGRESLEELKMRGDDGLLGLIRSREKERERSGFGRSMER